ncbi:MAG: hypothetical protein QM496_10325 [Verrucomicrobiota bacterium]
MKTTIELPDALFHQAKVVSAQRQITLKQLVIDGLEKIMPSPHSHEPIQLSPEEAKIYLIDEFGVPVLKNRKVPARDEFLSQIDQLQEELGA